MDFTNYPSGGGTVGVANEVQRYGVPNLPQQQIVSPEAAQALVRGLRSYGGASGSAPISAGAGQQSASALANAPMAQTGSVMSNYALPALAMTGLVKAGNKLKVGAKDQAHLYSKLLKKFTGMF